MSVERPTSFAQGDFTWANPTYTYDADVDTYGELDDTLDEDPMDGGIWSGYSGSEPDDAQFAIKISTSGFVNCEWALKASSLPSPDWTNPAHYVLIRDYSNSNVDQQTYTLDVPGGWSWATGKTHLALSKPTAPETVVVRVYDNRVESKGTGATTRAQVILTGN